MDDLELRFLDGGGATGERLRSFDWRATPIGVPAAWPTALRTLVSIMLASNQPMFVAWGPQRTLIYNEHYAPILGNKHPSALGRDFLEVWDEIRADLDPIVSAALRGEPVQMDDIPLVMHRHGYPEETHFSFFYAPVRDESGDVAGLYCACNEITAQVEAERRLAASEARYRGVLANMDEGFVLFDRDFVVLELNAEAERFAGASRATLLGVNLWALYPEARDADVGRMYHRVLANRVAESLEYEYTFEDGRHCWVEARAYPVAEGLAVFFHDVTERRRVAEQAALAAERVQLALDAGAIVGTWVWTIPDDRFVADARFAETFGLDVEQCRTGLTLDVPVSSIHPDDVARVEAAITEALGRGGPYRCEYRVRHHDGTYRWIEANGRVELDASGAPARFPGVLLDIEHRMRTEHERDRATALLRTFIEAVPGVVYAKDRDGRFLVLNRGAAELIGQPAEACIGRTDIEVLADKMQGEALMATDRRIMASGVAEQIEEAVRLADGTPAWWLSTKEPLRNAEGEVVGLIGSSVDITERKRIEDALRLSEQRSALAMDVAQLGTWTWDLGTGRVTADARCREVCGLPAGDAPLALEDFAARVHREDWPRIERALQDALAAGGERGFAEEFRWVHPGGRVAWTLARGQLLAVGEGEARTAEALLGSVIDVTERRRILESLEQADRRKDEFLAMLAHELRNPLAPIGTAAQLLQIAAGDAARVRQAGEIIARQVSHMTELVDDLLDVSRVTRGLVELDREPVELRAVVAAAIEQVEPVVQARGHALVTETSGSPVVLGDRHRLVQVVSNLLNNAAKYTPVGGRIELSCRIVDGAAQIRVADNGIGIDEGLLPRVFDLFTQAERTPDRAQGGLGIGLALVRSIVQLHGGQVEASSAGAMRGSVFTLTLPLSRAGAGAAEEGEPIPAGGSRSVLLVDDNHDAGESLADVLRLLGHRVTVATDAREGLEQAGRSSRWDAFILDIGLPDMTGYELVARIREVVRQPATYIALTGYGHAHDRVLSRQAGFDHHLVKPADLAQLQAILGTAAPAPR